MSWYQLRAGIVLGIGLLFSPAGADQYALPRHPAVEVFAHRAGQGDVAPLCRLERDESVRVVGRSGQWLQVESRQGCRGFVLQTEMVLIARSRQFGFETMSVPGWIDTRDVIFFLETDDPQERPVKLTRSFVDALGENVDRECVARLAHGPVRP